MFPFMDVSFPEKEISSFSFSFSFFTFLFSFSFLFFFNHFGRHPPHLFDLKPGAALLPLCGLCRVLPPPLDYRPPPGPLGVKFPQLKFQIPNSLEI